MQRLWVGLSLLLLGGIWFGWHTAYATDYSSTNFINRDPVINEYAGEATSTNFRQISSGGQVAIGESSSSNFILRSGFLYFAEATTATTTATSTTGGGSGGGVWTGSTQGGGGTQFPQITFRGRANGGALVSVLRNNSVVARYQTDGAGLFEVSLYELSPGYYFFSLFADTLEGRRSVTRAYSPYILNNAHVLIENIDLTLSDIPLPVPRPPVAAAPETILPPPAPGRIEYQSARPAPLRQLLIVAPRKFVIVAASQPVIGPIIEAYFQLPRMTLWTIVGVSFLVLLGLVTLRARGN